MSANSNTALPYFQRLQLQFSAHIRDPQNTAYVPEGEQPIESRRLIAYQELFFNISKVFLPKFFQSVRIF